MKKQRNKAAARPDSRICGSKKSGQTKFVKQKTECYHRLTNYRPLLIFLTFTNTTNPFLHAKSGSLSCRKQPFATQKPMKYGRKDGLLPPKRYRFRIRQKPIYTQHPHYQAFNRQHQIRHFFRKSSTVGERRCSRSLKPDQRTANNHHAAA